MAATISSVVGHAEVASSRRPGGPSGGASGEAGANEFIFCLNIHQKHVCSALLQMIKGLASWKVHVQSAALSEVCLPNWHDDLVDAGAVQWCRSSSKVIDSLSIHSASTLYGSRFAAEQQYKWELYIQPASVDAHALQISQPG
jgi:hypothetical protein